MQPFNVHFIPILLETTFWQTVTSLLRKCLDYVIHKESQIDTTKLKRITAGKDYLYWFPFESDHLCFHQFKEKRMWRETQRENHKYTNRMRGIIRNPISPLRASCVFNFIWKLHSDLRHMFPICLSHFKCSLWEGKATLWLYYQFSKLQKISLLTLY